MAELLASLLEQQQARRKDLKLLLEEMEAQRQHQAADYWLVQYQRLIDSMPQSVLANVEQLGKLNGHQRLKQEPSAPPMPQSDTFVNGVEPSAPADVFAETICVVCLDSLVSAQIFYPVSHVFNIIKINLFFFSVCAVSEYFPSLWSSLHMQQMLPNDRPVPHVPSVYSSKTPSSFLAILSLKQLLAPFFNRTN